MASYIPIDKNLIPYKFDVKVSTITYTMEFNYNAEHDFFTVAIATINEILTSGEKLVLGKALLSERPYIAFPLIKPLDSTGTAKKITWDNFGTTVLLYVGGSSE